MGSISVESLRSKYPGKNDVEIAAQLAEVAGYVVVLRYKNHGAADYTHFATCIQDEEVQEYFNSPYCNDVDILFDNRNHAAKITPTILNRYEDAPSAKKVSPTKECASCGKRYEEWRHRCPHCGHDIAVMGFTLDEFVSWSDRFKERKEAGQIVDKGASFFFEGNLKDAEKAFRKAIKKDPHSAPAYGNMGHVLQKRGMWAESIPWLEKALALDSQLEGVAASLELSKKATQEKAEPIPAELIARLKENGIKFIRKYTKTKKTSSGLGKVEFTYERYKAASVNQAIDFLNTRSVSFNYYYIEIDTPKGLIGKDIEGMYKTWE